MSWLAIRHAPATRSRWSSDKGGSSGSDNSGRERSAKAAWFAVLTEFPLLKENIVLYVRYFVKDDAYNLNELNFQNDADFPEAKKPGPTHFAMTVEKYSSPMPRTVL
jgi:hypothetical protein